jgi:hypothetical protein
MRLFRKMAWWYLEYFFPGFGIALTASVLEMYVRGGL